MENIWGIIKDEMYTLKTYNRFEELEKDIILYIKFYNTQRVTLMVGLEIPTTKKPCMKHSCMVQKYLFICLST